MSQRDAVDLTTLYVIEVIQKLAGYGPIALVDLGEELQHKIMGDAGGHPLWFTFGPHDSLAEFLLELQALGLVAVSAESRVWLTPQGAQLLETRALELEHLPQKLGLAA